MDVNEMMKQLANNPQMVGQLIGMMQQNGMIPQNVPQQRSMMNWDVPTNPMAAMWMNNLYSMMNSMMNQNAPQPAQNQTTQQSQAAQQPLTDNTVSSVRVVKTPNEIKADEIQMNGNISLFLQDDLNVVYGKRWTNNGTIENMRFVREFESAQNEVENQQPNQINSGNFNAEELMLKISEVMDSKLDQFKKDYSIEKRVSTKSSSNKKGVDENGE